MNFIRKYPIYFGFALGTIWGLSLYHLFMGGGIVHLEPAWQWWLLAAVLILVNYHRIKRVAKRVLGL